MNDPPFPPLNPLRLASPKDVLRIGVVAASGFRYSTVFDWERIYHDKYPSDTLLSYREKFTSLIKSPERIILVALDKYDPDEAKKSKAVIPPNNGAEIPAAGDEVVVGVLSLKLEPGSKRIGQLKDNKGPYPDLPQNLDRDVNKSHSIAFYKCLEATRKECFKGYPAIEMMVIHPAYWGREHGKNLVRWAMELARMDKKNLGAAAPELVQGASKSGDWIDLYDKLGFKILKEVHIEGDEIVPQGVSFTVLKYNSTGGR